LGFNLESKNNMTRLSFFLLSMLALSVGFIVFSSSQNQIREKIVGYLQRNTPTPTLVQATYEIVNQTQVVNGLKTFTNKDYRYSFSYPSDWQLLNEPNVQGMEIQKVDKNGLGFSISIRINDNPKKLSMEDYAKSQAEAKDTPEKVTVGGRQGYKLHLLPPTLTTTIYLPYSTNKVVYIFAGGEFNKSQDGFYTQVVSNFVKSLTLY